MQFNIMVNVQMILKTLGTMKHIKFSKAEKVNQMAMLCTMNDQQSNSKISYILINKQK